MLKTVKGRSFLTTTSPNRTSTSASTPNATSTSASICVSVSKIAVSAADVRVEVAEGEGFSHLESVWFTVERVAVRMGRSRKRPAPALAAPAKKDMPARSCAENPVARVREMEGRAAWKGRGVMVVPSLLGTGLVVG